MDSVSRLWQSLLEKIPPVPKQGALKVESFELELNEASRRSWGLLTGDLMNMNPATAFKTEFELMTQF